MRLCGKALLLLQFLPRIIRLGAGGDAGHQLWLYNVGDVEIRSQKIRVPSGDQIAEYLGVSVSTAQPYHRDGMPVHKPGNRVPGSQGPVFAFPSELKAWIRGGGSVNTSAPRDEDEDLFERTRKVMRDKLGPHALYKLAWSFFYGLLFGTALVLEVTYQFSAHQVLVFVAAPLSTLAIFLATLATFIWQERLIKSNSRMKLLLPALVLVAAAVSNYVILSFWLPKRPLVLAQFQTYAANAAYLKTTLYGVFVGLVFMVPPYVVVRSLERLLERGRLARVARLLSGDDRIAIAPAGVIFFRPISLAAIFILSLVTALVMMTHLMDNLIHNQFTWLFQQILWFRMTLFLCLGLATLWWFWTNLNELKRKCVSKSN